MDVGAGKAAMSKVVPGFPSKVRYDLKPCFPSLLLNEGFRLACLASSTLLAETRLHACHPNQILQCYCHCTSHAKSQMTLSSHVVCCGQLFGL